MELEIIDKKSIYMLYYHNLEIYDNKYIIKLDKKKSMTISINYLIKVGKIAAFFIQMKKMMMNLIQKQLI